MGASRGSARRAERRRREVGGEPGGAGVAVPPPYLGHPKRRSAALRAPRPRRREPDLPGRVPLRTLRVVVGEADDERDRPGEAGGREQGEADDEEDEPRHGDEEGRGVRVEVGDARVDVALHDDVASPSSDFHVVGGLPGLPGGGVTAAAGSGAEGSPAGGTSGRRGRTTGSTGGSSWPGGRRWCRRARSAGTAGTRAAGAPRTGAATGRRPGRARRPVPAAGPGSPRR